MASPERLTLSVRIYVICPFSYRCCATIIVCDTVKPSFLAASCCSVDVVNGGAGERLSGFFTTFSTKNSAVRHLSRKAKASSWVWKWVFRSAFTIAGSPVSAFTAVKTALTR